MLCLDYSNLQERRNMTKFYRMLEGIDFLSMFLEMTMLNSIFDKREMYQPKHNWFEIK